MIAVVVLVHDQERNLSRLLPAYAAQTQAPDLFVFVLDRCRDRSKEILEAFTAPKQIIEVESENFQAGRNRDIGAEAAYAALGPCDLVFLDGDCVPTPDLVRGFSEVFEAAKEYPVCVVGRRLNENERGNLVEDNRLKFPSAARRVFAKSMHRLVVSKEPAFCRLLTWSCCLGVNYNLATSLKHINNILDRKPTLFNDSFNGRWGGEDDFVGMTAWYLGAAVVALDPERCHVQHIHHLSRENSQYVGVMARKRGQLRSLCTRLRTPGVSFAQTQTSVFENEIDRSADVTSPGPVHQHLLANTQHKLAYWQVLSAHNALSGPLTPPRVSSADLSMLRVELESLQESPVEALSVLPQLKYTYQFTNERRCNICGDNRGFDGVGRCRGCCSMPWHRIGAVLMHGRQSGMVTNPESRGEKLLFQNWTQTSYREGVDLENLPYPDSSFQNIFSGHTLEHVRDDIRAMSEISRVLADDGIAVVAVPTMPGKTQEDTNDYLTKLERRQRFFWHDHYRVYGLRDIIARFERGGLAATPMYGSDFSDIPGVPADEVVFVCRKIKR